MHNGNERAALLTLRTAKEPKQLDRVILGTDSPAGSGVQPLGILRMIAMLASLGDIPAEIASCFTAGNTAKSGNSDCGPIAPGRRRHLCDDRQSPALSRKTVLESIQRGDLPVFGMVLVDGAVSVQRSRNTPPATTSPEIVPVRYGLWQGHAAG